jgi:hypothetical protein
MLMLDIWTWCENIFIIIIACYLQQNQPYDSQNNQINMFDLGKTRVFMSQIYLFLFLCEQLAVHFFIIIYISFTIEYKGKKNPIL